MNFIKKILFILLYVSIITSFSKIDAYPHLPLKGLFEVLKIDDIGFGHALLHSNWMENMYEYGQGNPARKQEGTRKLTKPTGNDPVVNLIRSLWFRLSEEEQFLPTQKRAFLGLVGEMFATLMNYIYSGEDLNSVAVKGETQKTKRKSLQVIREGFVDHLLKKSQEISDCLGGKKFKITRGSVENLIDLIQESLHYCRVNDTYMPRTIEAILWAFFFHKISFLTQEEQINSVKSCLDVINDDFKNTEITLSQLHTGQDLRSFIDQIKQEESIEGQERKLFSILLKSL